MKPLNDFFVNVDRDEETGVFYVVDTNVPGLNVEAETFDEIIRTSVELIPALLDLNDGHEPVEGGLPVHFMAKQLEKILVA